MNHLITLFKTNKHHFFMAYKYNFASKTTSIKYIDIRPEDTLSVDVDIIALVTVKLQATYISPRYDHIQIYSGVCVHYIQFLSKGPGMSMKPLPSCNVARCINPLGTSVTDILHSYFFRTVTPVWIHKWLWNDAESLRQQRRGILLFFKVVRLISRSHETKNHRFLPEKSVSGL